MESVGIARRSPAIGWPISFRETPCTPDRRLRTAAGALFLDHTPLGPADLEWLAGEETLILWNVAVSPGLLAQLPRLRDLEIRGGRGQDLLRLAGCRRLRRLRVRDVGGLADLSLLRQFDSLESLALYRLPRLERVASLAPLRHLRRVEIGMVGGLLGLGGLLDAPGLEELQLSRAVGITADDVRRVAAHPRLTRLTWFTDGEPSRHRERLLAAVRGPQFSP